MKKAEFLYLCRVVWSALLVETKLAIINYYNFYMKFFIGAALLLAGFVLGTGFDRYVEQPDAESTTENISQSVDVMFDDGQNIISISDVEITNDTTVADMLLRLQSNRDITLTYEDYGGELGLFVQEINGVGGDDAWWQYWVNAEYSNVGVSSQKIEHGDIILFKLSSEQYE
jgi:hypothetical protein